MCVIRTIALGFTLAWLSFAAHAADFNANNGTDGARDGFNLNAVVLQPHQQEYGALPWGDWAASYNFFSRHLGQQYPLPTGAPKVEDVSVDNAPSRQCTLTDAPTADSTVPVTGLPPTKTTPYRTKAHRPRDTFTFACPTSVQCNDGGCCPVGDYCAIKNGQLGCCPIGSECDASPIPGCSVSCFGICCDLIPTIEGGSTCSPTPGDGGQSSGICTSLEPTSPLATLTSNCNKLSEFACGQECCPNGAGLICDNSTIPGVAFCNIPDNVDPSESVTTDTAAFTSVQYNTTALSMLSITIPPAATANANVTGSTGSTAATTGSMATTAASGASKTTTAASGASKTTTATTAGAASKTTTNPTASFSSAAGRQRQGIWWLADAAGTAIGGVVALLGGTLFALL